MKLFGHKIYIFTVILSLVVSVSVLVVYWLLPPKDQPIINISQAEQFKTRQESLEKEPPVKILLVGDIMLDRHVATLIGRKGLASLVSGLKDNGFFNGYDFVGGNLEGAVTDNGDHYPPVKENDFAFKPANVSALKDYGFNFFTIANNHLYDQGKSGLEQNKNNLTELGFKFAGNQEGVINDQSVLILNRDEVKIGLVSLSFTYTKPDEAAVKKIIEETKPRVDWLVISVHWGDEYQHQANTEQQRLAYLMIDSGADLIVGHHPHVIQQTEDYKNGLIFYSLGNFLFDQYFSVATQEGLALSLDFEGKQPEGRLIALKSQTSVLRLATTEESQAMIKKYKLKTKFTLKKQTK